MEFGDLVSLHFLSAIGGAATRALDCRQNCAQNFVAIIDVIASADGNAKYTITLDI